MKKPRAPSQPEGDSMGTESKDDLGREGIFSKNVVKYCTFGLCALSLVLLGVTVGLVLSLKEESVSKSSTFPPVTSAPEPIQELSSHPTPSPTKPFCDQVELFTEIRGDEDYVGVVFLDCPTPEVYGAYIKAARRWSEIIVSTRITPSYLPNNDICDRRSNFIFNNNGQPTDHLTIYSSLSDIEMYNGDVASSGFCVLDFSTKFPILGYVDLSLEVLPSLIADDTLETVVLHEMAHVLGFGRSWRFMGQDGKDGFNPLQPAQKRLLKDPVYQLLFDTTGELIAITAEPTNKPLFTGSAALSRYRHLGGKNQKGIPLEDGDGIFNTESWGGIEDVDNHWSHSVFEDELMVYRIEPLIQYKLSKITIASLADLGYDVDYSKADSYSVPTKNLRGRVSVAQKKQTSKLLSGETRFHQIGVGLPAT